MIKHVLSILGLIAKLAASVAIFFMGKSHEQGKQAQRENKAAKDAKDTEHRIHTDSDYRKRVLDKFKR